MSGRTKRNEVRPSEAYETHARETHCWIRYGKDRALVESNIKGFVQRLVRHPKFDPLRITRVEPDGTLRYSETLETHASLPIVRVEGYLPVGVLKIGLNPREDSHQTSIITETVYGEGRE